MKKLFFILFSSSLLAQTAFQNTGNVLLHEGAQVGFHTDVVNNGTLDNTVGFAGFYADNEVRTIAGTNRVIFYDVEIDALQNLQLLNSLGVRNQLDFINGQVLTPRDDNTISLDFINYDIYAGEDGARHINGYASITRSTQNTNFVFPIGDDNRLRPMTINSPSGSYNFNGAYFFQDPNNPVYFTTNFSTSTKQTIIDKVSDQEFWDLNGTEPTQVTLTWDFYSDISNLSDKLKDLRVVGWNIENNQWEDLGNVNTEGDLTSGTITSVDFIPNLYEVITIGTLNSDTKVNYLISPNGDSLNDSLVFESLENFTNNTLQIFNRWGNIVYEIENYKNDWGGISNGRLTINKSKKLPVGTYFYILKFGNGGNLDNIKKGWVYINR